MTPPGRDPAELAARLADWLHHLRPECDPFEVVEAEPADGGYSSDVMFVTLDAADGACAGRRELVLRLPPLAPGLFRHYDLAAQAAAQDVVRAAGVPVPEFVTVESDVTWLGAPFQLMPRVAGHVPGPLASIDDWIVGLGVDGQARLQGGFLDALARVHTTPWAGTGLEGRLRGAVLDWEMAAIGPAESDLAWYLALDEVGNEVVGRTVPGFLDRDAAIARHEAAIGRPLVAFRWFEIVALGRAAALNLRKSALKSARLGRPLRAAGEDRVLQHAVRAISAG